MWKTDFSWDVNLRTDVFLKTKHEKSLKLFKKDCKKVTDIFHKRPPATYILYVCRTSTPNQLFIYKNTEETLRLTKHETWQTWWLEVPEASCCLKTVFNLQAVHLWLWIVHVIRNASLTWGMRRIFTIQAWRQPLNLGVQDPNGQRLVPRRQVGLRLLANRERNIAQRLLLDPRGFGIFQCLLRVD